MLSIWAVDRPPHAYSDQRQVRLEGFQVPECQDDAGQCATVRAAGRYKAQLVSSFKSRGLPPVNKQSNSQTNQHEADRVIEMFVPAIRDIAQEFGDRFLLAMLQWCEIGRRSTPLKYWQVFLIRAQSETVGVSGL
jgi:hypothetical protein